MFWENFIVLVQWFLFQLWLGVCEPVVWIRIVIVREFSLCVGLLFELGMLSAELCILPQAFPS